MSSVIRDFKKFTSQTILEQIEKNTEESRCGCPPPSVPARAGVPVRTGMLWIFKSVGTTNSRNSTYQFWQQDNQPILLEHQISLWLSCNTSITTLLRPAFLKSPKIIC